MLYIQSVLNGSSSFIVEGYINVNTVYVNIYECIGNYLKQEIALNKWYVHVAVSKCITGNMSKI